jgi:hypothetical protein
MAKRIPDKDNPNSPDFEDDDHGLTPKQIDAMGIEGHTPEEARRLDEFLDEEYERQAQAIAEAYKKVPEKDKDIVMDGAHLSEEEATGDMISAGDCGSRPLGRKKKEKK